MHHLHQPFIAGLLRVFDHVYEEDLGNARVRQTKHPDQLNSHSRRPGNSDDVSANSKPRSNDVLQPPEERILRGKIHELHITKDTLKITRSIIRGNRSKIHNSVATSGRLGRSNSQVGTHRLVTPREVRTGLFQKASQYSLRIQTELSVAYTSVQTPHQHAVELRGCPHGDVGFRLLDRLLLTGVRVYRAAGDHGRRRSHLGQFRGAWRSHFVRESIRPCSRPRYGFKLLRCRISLRGSGHVCAIAAGDPQKPRI